VYSVTWLPIDSMSQINNTSLEPVVFSLPTFSAGNYSFHIRKCQLSASS